MADTTSNPTARTPSSFLGASHNSTPAPVTPSAAIPNDILGAITPTTPPNAPTFVADSRAWLSTLESPILSFASIDDQDIPAAPDLAAAENTGFTDSSPIDPDAAALEAFEGSAPVDDAFWQLIDEEPQSLIEDLDLGVGAGRNIPVTDLQDTSNADTSVEEMNGSQMIGLTVDTAGVPVKESDAVRGETATEKPQKVDERNNDVMFGESNEEVVLSSITNTGSENASSQNVTPNDSVDSMNSVADVDNVSNAGDNESPEGRNIGNKVTQKRKKIGSAAKSDDGGVSEKGVKVGRLELARRKAEAFAADEADKRKERLGLLGKRGREDDADGAGKKYQKRLEKNRNSAYVSRIRRRKYAKLLEESLEESEVENDRVWEMYNKLKHQYDLVSSELSAMKAAAKSKISGVAQSIIENATTGITGGSAANRSSSIVSMFALALIVAVCLPVTNMHRTNYDSNGGVGGRGPTKGGNVLFGGQQKGPIPLYESFLQDFYRQTPDVGKMWGYTAALSKDDEKERKEEEEENVASDEARNTNEAEGCAEGGERSLLKFLCQNSTQLFGPQRAEEVREMVRTRYNELDQAGSSAAHAERSKRLQEEEQRIIREGEGTNNAGSGTTSEGYSLGRLLSMLPSIQGMSDEKFTAELIRLLTLHLITEHKMRAAKVGS